MPYAEKEEAEASSRVLAVDSLSGAGDLRENAQAGPAFFVSAIFGPRRGRPCITKNYESFHFRDSFPPPQNFIKPPGSSGITVPGIGECKGVFRFVTFFFF